MVGCKGNLLKGPTQKQKGRHNKKRIEQENIIQRRYFNINLTLSVFYVRVCI